MAASRDHRDLRGRAGRGPHPHAPGPAGGHGAVRLRGRAALRPVLALAVRGLLRAPAVLWGPAAGPVALARRTAGAPAERGLGAAAVPVASASGRGVQPVLRGAALPGAHRHPDLALRVASRVLPAHPDDRGALHRRVAARPVHPGRAAAHAARHGAGRHGGPVRAVGLRVARARRGPVLGHALGARRLGPDRGHRGDHRVPEPLALGRAALSGPHDARRGGDGQPLLAGRDRGGGAGAGCAGRSAGGGLPARVLADPDRPGRPGRPGRPLPRAGNGGRGGPFGIRGLFRTRGAGQLRGRRGSGLR